MRQQEDVKGALKFWNFNVSGHFAPWFYLETMALFCYNLSLSDDIYLLLLLITFLLLILIITILFKTRRDEWKVMFSS